jgi:peptidoglycan/LPS O-acetylase OafA/YrhL
MVVVCHARYMLHGTPYEQFTETYMLPGAMGVDLFFLISGFIMVQTTVSSTGSLAYVGDFMVKRFARVWPLYACSVAAILCIAFLTGGWIPPVSSIAESLAFLPVDARAPMYYKLPYAIGWTLNFEFYFYLVFAVSMLAGRYRWFAFFSFMAFSLIAVPLIFTGTVSLTPTNDYHLPIAYLDQMTSPIIWNFVAGVVVGMVYRLDPVVPRIPGYVAVACTWAFALWWPMSGHANFHGVANWGWPLIAAFMTSAVVYRSYPPRVHRALMWLGDVSYSLYLFHLIAFTIITTILTKMGKEPVTHTVGFLLCAIPIALLVASLANKYIEKHLSSRVKDALLASIHRTKADIEPIPIRSP